MIPHVTDASYIGNYKIQVSFNNGKTGIADLSNALKGQMFEPLKDLALFSQLKLDEELETVVWPNGADLAPEFIFFLAFKDDLSLKEQFTKWGYIS